MKANEDNDNLSFPLNGRKKEENSNVLRTQIIIPIRRYRSLLWGTETSNESFVLFRSFDSSSHWHSFRETLELGLRIEKKKTAKSRSVTRRNCATVVWWLVGCGLVPQSDARRTTHFAEPRKRKNSQEYTTWKKSRKNWRWTCYHRYLAPRSSSLSRLLATNLW